MEEIINRILRTRTLSNFEKRGKPLLSILKEMQETKNFSTINKYQIDRVLETELINKDGTRKPSDPIVIVASGSDDKLGLIVLLPYVLRARRAVVLAPSPWRSEQLARAFGLLCRQNSFFYTSGFSKQGSSWCKISEKEVLDNLLTDGVLIKDKTDATSEILGVHHSLVVFHADLFTENERQLTYKRQDIIPNVEMFFSAFDTLIVDEAHKFPAYFWRSLVDTFMKDTKEFKNQIIFISETPFNPYSLRHLVA